VSRYAERTLSWYLGIHIIDVLSLVYNALESEHAVVCAERLLLFPLLIAVSKVQERALKTVPGLCETIDYAKVQSVLFPRVAVSMLHGS
jgi:SCY1-like protein 2